MSKVDVTDRLEFLAERFDVFECDEENLETKTSELMEGGCTDIETVTTDNGTILGLVCLTEVTKIDSRDGTEYIKVNRDVSIAYDVFMSMVQSDPSNNKKYAQWMLSVFTRLLKDSGNLESAIRFADEDLPLAKEYLELFESNKRKQKFKELCSSSYVLKGVKDPTNINQYKSLSQLYDAVDPFIIRDPSEMERLLQKFVDAGQATIPVRDRKFTVFIPKTRDANVSFNKFASWCTCSPNNGMFKNYTSGASYKRPNGENSTIYIVIDNRFFEGELEDNYLYQIHFESNQVRNRKQNGKGNFFEEVILKSEGVANFFNEELTSMAKISPNVTNNKYINYLIKFGWTEALFDIIEEFTPYIRFTDRDVPRLPDISRFKKLNTLVIKGAKLAELHPSIGRLETLQELLLPNNKLTSLPKEIGNLKNLIMLNVIGNRIQEIPEEIKYLDKTNGGRLHRIAVKREEVGEENYQRLIRLLPSVKM